MKYLKSYESKLIDDILDKISKTGMKSLTPSERNYLNNVFKGDTKELEDIVKYKKNKISSIFEYDPREDQDFFDELGDEIGIPFDFRDYDDEEIEQGRYEIIYNDIDEEDLDHFVEYFDIKDCKKEYKGKDVYKPWHELSQETQNKFKKYIKEIY